MRNSSPPTGPGRFYSLRTTPSNVDSQFPGTATFIIILDLQLFQGFGAVVEGRHETGKQWYAEIDIIPRAETWRLPYPPV